MALALNNMKRVDMPLNKETKPNEFKRRSPSEKWWFYSFKRSILLTCFILDPNCSQWYLVPNMLTYNSKVLWNFHVVFIEIKNVVCKKLQFRIFWLWNFAGVCSAKHSYYLLGVDYMVDIVILLTRGHNRNIGCSKQEAGISNFSNIEVLYGVAMVLFHS